MFSDRREAGRRLATALDHLKGTADVVVTAIPRGGVVVAAEVARSLGAPLDVVIPRKIGAPGNPELAIGAVAGDGVLVLNEDISMRLGIDEDYLQREKARQMVEIERRRKAYLKGRPGVEIAGKTVVLVDDGLATGSTALAAARALKRGRPERLILAVPVAPRETLKRFSREVDEIVCLEAPTLFYAVGQFYRDFGQTTDDEVMAILAETAQVADQEKTDR